MVDVDQIAQSAQEKFLKAHTQGTGFYGSADGLAIGATRAQLQAAGDLQIKASTIGVEFTFNGISGLLGAKDQAARVTNLWAGTTCIFR